MIEARVVRQTVERRSGLSVLASPLWAVTLANGFAAADSWPKMLGFLEKHFK